MVVHVWGRGWGFFANDVDQILYQPTVSVSRQSGSLQGGSQFSVLGVGLGHGGAAENQVLIGNTPCDVQSLTTTDQSRNAGALSCITRPPVDDGYSAVIRRDHPLVYWQDPIVSGSQRWSARTLTNNGSLGSVSNAHFTNSKFFSQRGLHEGTPVAGTAVYLDSRSSAMVPFAENLFVNWTFSTELWIRLDSSGASNLGYYRRVISAHDTGDFSTGYSLWVNPCGNLEFWLGTGQNTSSNLDPSLQNCPLIALTTTVPENVTQECQNLPMGICSGLRFVRPPSSSFSPTGVWSVIQMPDSDLTNWTHVVLSWEGESDEFTPCGSSSCRGYQKMYINGQQVASIGANYSRPQAAMLQIGGGSSSSGEQRPFEGWLDETAVYGIPLTADQVRKHHHFGTSDEQLVTITVNGYNRQGKGITPNVSSTVLAK